MDDVPPLPDTDDDGGKERAAHRPSGTPRWVKVFAIVAVVVVLLLVIHSLLTGGHGPSRHTGGLGAQAPLASVTMEAGHPLPEGALR